ncbi:hypothetical protein BDV96DRAFT_271884 [Lophiotrema nucula]|uniref:HTH La-type RNA-binding domain-containing protein n=1 Tax=Lophiotrema nucula TaxID=690887 RepID=A0A6A5ZLZ5_9PLEO|nr:hypothetical protein BDV96DRAFT_271884 [Lophiotrema nucula]
MATTPHRSGSDAMAPPVPFSYAQAAKGLSSTGTAATSTSKPSSGALTPSKDVNGPSATAPVSSVTSWADDAEANDTRVEKQPSKRDRSHGAPVTTKSANSQAPTATSSISSPDLGASSASTVTKDDDVASLQNTSSESTWENKSQASTSVEKTAEPVERTSEKVKKGKNMEKSTFKPLQEAPVPVVNIWKQRAEELKAKSQKASTARPAPSASPTTLPNGTAQPPVGAATKKSKPVVGADTTENKDRNTTAEDRTRPREDEKEKSSQVRRESRPDLEGDKARKGSKGRVAEKEVKPSPEILPPPPNADQASWPTPLGAVDEDKKKTQVKGDKGERERKETVTAKSHGKHEWVSVPYTPTVVFNTPLPTTAASRRGGRGGGRGGAQNGSRNSGYSNSVAGAPDKDTSTPSNLSNGEQPKRGREASPVRTKRAASAGSTNAKEVKHTVVPNETVAKASAGQDINASSRGASAITEPESGPQVLSQSSTLPRHYASNRPGKGRRGEYPGQGERRRDADTVSPSKENFDRRNSTVAPSEFTEDGSRLVNGYQEGLNSQAKPAPNDRPKYGSFGGRERPRGGGRGRGNYQNGHQFPNGHTPHMQSSSAFPLRSPGPFHPDPTAYFAPPNSSRQYKGNPRSQSVTTDNMYGRFPGYPQGPQMIQTAGPGMYDFNGMQPPMSAMPFSPYGNTETAYLFSMVTTQLEYYFSVDNLCKDMFLRKHMDSQGFVFLSVIAEFNRIKQLTTDLELIKAVCFQSPVIEFRVGADGKDRLRRHEGWEQWVLNLAERHQSAQNDGPNEVYLPAVPHSHSFDQAGAGRYPEVSVETPSGLGPFTSEIPYPPVNGLHHGSLPNGSVSLGDRAPNGVPVNGVNGPETMNGHVDFPGKHSNGEPDSFSNEQVETLSVIVRKQETTQPLALPPSAQRTFSNGSIDSKSGVPDEAVPSQG